MPILFIFMFLSIFAGLVIAISITYALILDYIKNKDGGKHG